MATLFKDPPLKRAEKSKPASIQTTLYELIEAVNEEVDREEERLVVDVVTRLLEKSRIKTRDFNKRLFN